MANLSHSSTSSAPSVRHVVRRYRLLTIDRAIWAGLWLESGKQYDGHGNCYERVARGEAGGHNNIVINRPHPFLYIRHLTNVYLPQGTTSGAIGIIPGLAST